MAKVIPLHRGFVADGCDDDCQTGARPCECGIGALTEADVDRHIAERYGCPTTRPNSMLRDDRGRAARQVDDDVVRGMHADKASTAEIARALGVHKSTVHAAFKRLGLVSHYGRIVNTGDRFGRYVVLREVEPDVRASGVRVRAVMAKCACGTEKKVRLESLWSGTTVSCGCYHAEVTAAVLPKASVTHGMSRTSLHRIWSAMKARCTNPANKRWANYGGRGIRVCEEWMRSFLAFAAHVGQRPEGRTLDRVDNDGNYEPGNVRWATHVEQANNRRPRRVQP